MWCSPESPVEFLPSLRTTVNSEGKIVVSIDCVSEASPQAVVSWFKGGEAVSSGMTYQISSDTTQLQIRDRNVSIILLYNYTCTCSNILGSKSREIQLRGILFSDCHLYCLDAEYFAQQAITSNLFSLSLRTC